MTQEFKLTSVVSGDITLYAGWKVNAFTVTLNHDGGTGVASVAADYNTTIAQPTSTKVGYTFDGWYNGDTKFDFATKIVGDITLTAHWTVNKYTVTFDYQGKGTGLTTKEVTFDQAYGELPIPTAVSGYTFGGWFTLTTGGDEVTAATVVKTANAVTLYARWNEVLSLAAPTNISKWDDALT
ncbi:MAG: InlB B-repeat-containing protein, partial [Clostridia bacterium]